jgi:hypothetical protein
MNNAGLSIAWTCLYTLYFFYWRVMYMSIPCSFSTKVTVTLNLHIFFRGAWRQAIIVMILSYHIPKNCVRNVNNLGTAAEVHILWVQEQKLRVISLGHRHSRSVPYCSVHQDRNRGRTSWQVWLIDIKLNIVIKSIFLSCNVWLQLEQ